MPAPVTYSNIAALLERIQQRMTVNGAQENTGARTQQLLQEIALSLIAIIGDAPDAVGSIQPWDAGLEYTDQVIVSHNGSLWLYAGGGPNTGTQPGTDNTVWFSLGAPPTPSLAQVLTVGQRTGAHDLDVDAGQAIAFRGPESDGRIRLVPTAVTDDGEIKLPNANGTLALTSQLPDMSAIDLHAVLVNGTETNGRSITVSEGDGINYKAGGKQVRVKAPASLAADRNVQWPDKSGTVATTDDVAGRLSVYANLSDVHDYTAARNNLGLGRLAVQDYAEALIKHDPVNTGEDGMNPGDCVCINAAGEAMFATPALAAAGKVMVVVETFESQVRLQMAGYCEYFSGLGAGKAYYLDPALPGKITSTRPAMHAVYVGVAMGSKSIILAPDMPLPSGSAVLAADMFTNDAYGINTDLKSPELAPGLYDVTVQAQVSTAAGAGRGVLWLGLAAGGDARGMTAIAMDDKTGTVYTDVDLTTKSAAIHDIGDGGVTEQTIRALVNISGKTGITVWVAPRVTGYKATLKAGSVMTWNRIG